MKKFAKLQLFLSLSFLSVGVVPTLFSCGGTGQEHVQKFKITLGDLGGAEATLSTTEAKEGEQVDINITSIPANKIIESVSCGEGIAVTKDSDTKYHFEMPKVDVVVTFVVKQTKFNVAFTPDEAHPDTEIEVYTATTMEQKTLPFTATIGESFNVFAFNDKETISGLFANGTALEKIESSNAYLLTIGTEDIVLTCSYEEKKPVTGDYNIVYNVDPDHASLEVTFLDENMNEVKKAKSGSTVYIMTFFEDSSLTLPQKAFANGVEATSLGESMPGAFQFTMPNADAVITFTY